MNNATARPAKPGFHSIKAQDALKQLKSSRKGLSWVEARNRIGRFGKNEIALKRTVSPLRIFISQFTSPLIIILMIAAIVSYGIGFVPGQNPHIVDAVLILIIVFANGIFGFLQEFNAEKSIEALKRLSPSYATVMRGNEKAFIDAAELVPGDIIMISAGDKVGADARILEASELRVDESLLTGESSPVSKASGLFPADAQLHERSNMLFKDTVAVRGKALALVTGTGLDTELGKIAQSIQEVPPKMTPFQVELEHLGKKLGFAIIGIIVFITSESLKLIPLKKEPCFDFFFIILIN